MLSGAKHLALRDHAMQHRSRQAPGTEDKMATAKDPVCGMDVDTATAAAKSDYNGTTYYFCAPGCKRDFDAAPEKYT